MSLMGIIILVLVATIILSILFSLFHVFVALLPVAIIAVVIIWLLVKISAKRNGNEKSDVGISNPYMKSDTSNKGRKKARNVKVKDVDK